MKSTQEIYPRRALLHPLWLGALALLVVNDHILKDSVLAGVVTGKLSDVAGLFFVPVLVAAILNVKTKRGLYGCAVVVGAIFSATNLSPVAAEVWNQLMGLFFFGFVTTVDWTDLFALVMIPIGLRLLMPTMEVDEVGEVPGASKMSRRRRFATLAAALVGGLACLGASIDEPLPEIAEFPGFEAQVTVANMSRELTEVRVHPLRGQVLVDCDTIENAPGEFISPLLFSEDISSYVWRIGSGQQFGIGDVEGGPSVFSGGNNVWRAEQPCEVHLITTPLPVEDIIVFWGDDLPMKSFSVEPRWDEGDSVEGPSLIMRADYTDSAAEEMKDFGEAACTYHEGDSWHCLRYREYSSPPEGARFYWESTVPGPEFGASRDEEDFGSCWRPRENSQVGWQQLSEWDREWVIDGVEQNDERCKDYGLVGADGEGAAETITLCGPARIHEVLEEVGQRGDGLRFSTEVVGQEYRQLEIEITAGDSEGDSLPGHLILYRGFGLPEAIEATARWEATGECAPAFDSCGNTWVDSQLWLGDELEGIGIGESGVVGPGQTLWLAGASNHAVVVRDCAVENANFPGTPEAPAVFMEALLELESQ